MANPVATIKESHHTMTITLPFKDDLKVDLIWGHTKSSIGANFSLDKKQGKKILDIFTAFMEKETGKNQSRQIPVYSSQIC